MNQDPEAIPAIEAVSPHSDSDFRAVPWRRRDLVLGLAPLVATRCLELFGQVPAFAYRLPAWTWIVLTMVGLGWMALYPLWAARRRIGPFRMVRPRSIAREVMIAAGVAVPLFVTMGLTTTILRNALGPDRMPNPIESLTREADGYHMIALTLLAVTVGPVAEELFFRGLVYNAIRRRVGIGVGIVVSATLFAVNHPFGIPDLVATGLVGVALALIYEWRRTLLAPVLVHIIINLAASVILNATAAAYAAGPVLGVFGNAADGGVRLAQVVPSGAAAAAGLQVGDVVLAIDSNAITDQPTLVRTIRAYKPGDAITIRYTRAGIPAEVRAVLRKRSDP